MLTNRLRAIVNYVRCKTAADIGTDHAFVPIELIKTGRAERVIASDVREGPLRSADENIRLNGLSDRIETRLGSGLSILAPGEAEDVVIAGMGGKLIIDFLRESERTARASRLILQPMSAQYELRKFLISEGYTIVSEDIAAEGFKVYNVFEVKNGRQTPFDTEFEYQIPHCLAEHECFPALRDKKLREFRKISGGLERSGDTDCEKYRLYRYFLEECTKRYGES